MTPTRTIAVIGTGYVGLVTGAGLASLGHRVALADIDPQRIKTLESGDLPIYEEGLDRLISENRSNLTYTTDNLVAVEGAEMVFLCLPTPESRDGSADLSSIEAVVQQITPKLAGETTLVIKSTVPPGTAASISNEVRSLRDDVGVVSHPEFLREGRAVRDFLAPNRLVFGGAPALAESVANIYKALGDVEHVLTDLTSAEMIKYASNSYLAARLTFVNTLAKVCEIVGADILEVTRGMGFDDRIGPHFLQPGPGFGGSCFPKDTAALVAIAEEKGYRFSLLEAIIDADVETRRGIVEKVADAVEGDLEGKRVALWGMAFKAGTDDTRESPALKLATALLRQGALVVGYDPMAKTDMIEMASSPVDACNRADVLLVATEWPDFLRVDLSEVAQIMTGDVVIDARNHLDPKKVERAGLRYTGFGRPHLATL